MYLWDIQHESHWSLQTSNLSQKKASNHHFSHSKTATKFWKIKLEDFLSRLALEGNKNFQNLIFAATAYFKMWNKDLPSLNEYIGEHNSITNEYTCKTLLCIISAVSFPWYSLSTLFNASRHLLYHSIWKLFQWYPRKAHENHDSECLILAKKGGRKQEAIKL